MCLFNGRVRCPHKVSVSLFTFGTWDRSQLVGLGIPLRFIAKPSYSGHWTSTHVGRKPRAPKNLTTNFMKPGFKSRWTWMQKFKNRDCIFPARDLDAFQNYFSAWGLNFGSPDNWEKSKTYPRRVCNTGTRFRSRGQLERLCPRAKVWCADRSVWP